jgi:spore germination protein KA
MFKNPSENNAAGQAPKDGGSHELLTNSLSENISLFKTILNNDDMLTFRMIDNRHMNDFHACLIYLDGMIDNNIVSQSVVCPLMEAELNVANISEALDFLGNKIICTNHMEKTNRVDDLLLALFQGGALLLVDLCDMALIVDCKGWQVRALVEPNLEKALKGPREGFTEAIMTNLTLIRKRLKTPDLKFKFRELGVRSRTRVCICYIESLVNERILRELGQRLDKVNIDGVLASNTIDELIKDCPLSPFKTIGNTERPDVVAAKLLVGRIAVIIDGTPTVMTLPYIFMEYFQTSEDYYVNYVYGSINRLLRCLGAFFTTSIPALYVALITFHQEMMPDQLLLSIAAARQDVPFPSVIEAIILLFIFEVIREAGIRMPSALGQSVSIVGALILGQAAVQARLFSAPMVVVVAATGITGLLVIKMSGSLIVLRIIFLMLSSFMGLYGYIFAVVGAMIYLFGMRSFGVPYMLEIGSLKATDLKDTFVRAPWWFMTDRHRTFTKDTVRQQPPQAKDKV